MLQWLAIPSSFIRHNNKKHAFSHSNQLWLARFFCLHRRPPQLGSGWIFIAFRSKIIFLFFPSPSLMCQQERTFLFFFAFFRIFCGHVNFYAFIFSPLFVLYMLPHMVLLCTMSQISKKRAQEEEEGNKKLLWERTERTREWEVREKDMREAVFEWEMAFDLLHQEGCKIFCLPT